MREQTALARRPRRRPLLQRVAGRRPRPPGSGRWPTTRPSPLFFGRLDRTPDGEAPTARPSTSAAGTSPTSRRAAGARLAGADVAGRSTGPPGPSRWASACAAGSASTRGQLTAFEDEHLTDRGETRAIASRDPAAEIERPRVGPMRDIVATIQPEQDVLVRAELDDTHLRAGRPRHRQDRGRPAPGGVPALRAPRPAAPAGVLVVGPNRLPALHRDVLPALGEIERHATTTVRRPGRAGPGPRRWTRRGGRRSRATRGWPRCWPGAVVARPPSRPTALVVPRGARRWRVPPYEARRSRRRACARAASAYGAARADAAAAPGRTRSCCRWSAAGDSPTTGCRTRWPGSSEVTRVRRTRSGRRSTPAALVFALLTDPAALAGAADGPARPRTSRRCCSGTTPPRSPRQRPLVGRRRGADRRGGRPGRAEPQSLGHVVARRGAGPVRRCSCGRRPPLLHRLADRARRPRPGHHAVGDRRTWHAGAGATSASRTRTSSR